MVRRNAGFRASNDGLSVIRQARIDKGWLWSVDDDDEPLVIASRYLEPDKSFPIETAQGKIYAGNIHEGSWRRFLAGKIGVPVRAFIAYSKALEVQWELVVDWNCLNGNLPFNFVETIFISQEMTNPLGFLNQDSSEFIRDVTTPDGSILKIGEEFVKIWEIRNSGNLYWKGRFLKRIGPCEGTGLISSPKLVKVPDTAPGDSVEIAVRLQAPRVAATTVASWKMIYGNGKLCFPNRYNCGLFVTIQVICYL